MATRKTSSTSTDPATKPAPASKSTPSTESEPIHPHARGWGATSVQIGSGKSVPRVIILGRGQLATRKLFATRLPEEVMERLRGLVSGPDYLALQLAVTAYCDALDARSDTQMIPAENLG